jgi:hypothetical protein
MFKGPNGERTPFRFLECDVQGGDANQIQDADAALALLFSQFPFVSEGYPNAIWSLSWPTNMEAQDLFPLKASTYTFPTGVKVNVPCFAQNKAVDIKRTECPDSFVNPMNPNHDRPCVKVLHASTRCLHPLACFSHSLPMPCIAHAALPSGSILRRGVRTNVGWKQYCRIDWFGVERVHVHDLVRSCIISIVPFVFFSSTWTFFSVLYDCAGG